MQGAEAQRIERVLDGDGASSIDRTSEQWVERFTHGGSADDAAAARRRVEDILGGEDFAEDSQSGWLDEFVEWLDDLFEGDGSEYQESEVSPPGGGTSLEGLKGAVQVFSIVVLAIVVVALLVAAARKYERKRKTDPETLTLAERVASRVEELRAQARAAAAAGEWVEALRLEFFALVVGLGERGDLEYRDAWTNRELLERGRPRPAVERALRPVVRRLDAHSFGHLPSGPEEVAEFQRFCEGLSRGTS